MRIVSWNILQGGGKRAADIAQAISDFQADVLVLQEFRNGNAALEILNAIESCGLIHLHLPKAQARINVQLLASRYPMQITPWNDELDSKITAKAVIQIDNNALTLYACHSPQKRKQVPYLDFLNKLSIESDQHAMIIGDVNCGIPFEDSETKSFDNTHQFQSLLRSKWVDSWRSRNPKAREYSWISSRGNGYRYDHCLCSTGLDSSVLEVGYEHALREAGLSDHSAINLKLDWPYQQ